MSSFGFSVGDIIAAGKLAKDIYENCFTREQAAGEFLIHCSVDPRLPLGWAFLFRSISIRHVTLGVLLITPELRTLLTTLQT